MLDLKSSIETSLTVSGLSLAQFNFMLEACCALASSYKVCRYSSYLLLTVLTPVCISVPIYYVHTYTEATYCGLCRCSLYGRVFKVHTVVVEIVYLVV